MEKAEKMTEKSQRSKLCIYTKIPYTQDLNFVNLSVRSHWALTEESCTRAVTGDACLRRPELRSFAECILLCGLPMLRQQGVQLLFWNHVHPR